LEARKGVVGGRKREGKSFWVRPLSRRSNPGANISGLEKVREVEDGMRQKGARRFTSGVEAVAQLKKHSFGRDITVCWKRSRGSSGWSVGTGRGSKARG